MGSSHAPRQHSSGRSACRCGEPPVVAAPMTAARPSRVSAATWPSPVRSADGTSRSLKRRRGSASAVALRQTAAMACHEWPGGCNGNGSARTKGRAAHAELNNVAFTRSTSRYPYAVRQGAALSPEMPAILRADSVPVPDRPPSGIIEGQATRVGHATRHGVNHTGTSFRGSKLFVCCVSFGRAHHRVPVRRRPALGGSGPFATPQFGESS